VVKHPIKYEICGYSETQKPPGRYRVIDTQANLDYFDMANETAFQEAKSIWLNKS